MHTHCTHIYYTSSDYIIVASATTTPNCLLNIKKNKSNNNKEQYDETPVNYYTLYLIVTGVILDIWTHRSSFCKPNYLQRFWIVGPSIALQAHRKAGQGSIVCTCYLAEHLREQGTKPRRSMGLEYLPTCYHKKRPKRRDFKYSLHIRHLVTKARKIGDNS